MLDMGKPPSVAAARIWWRVGQWQSGVRSSRATAAASPATTGIWQGSVPSWSCAPRRPPVLEFWARFGDSPLFTGITLAMLLSYLVYFTLMVTYRMLVRGTRRSYMTASLLNVLG